jgi:uncharacterized membrane protein YidH (DUF202 family)
MEILFGFLALAIPLGIVIGLILFIIKVSRNEENKSQMTTKEITLDSSLFVMLITSIIFFVSIIFAAIDKKFVDALNAYNQYNSMWNEDVRVAVSVILVSFPIYLGLAYYRGRYLSKNKDRLEIKGLRNLSYITLGAAGLFVVGCVVTTIYQYLGGELGITFFYKILTIVSIALFVGLYNYYSLTRDYNKKSNVPHVFAMISLLLVIGSVIYSINILGSPAEIRKKRFDEKRLQDLSSIQGEIVNYWTRTKSLPSDLESLRDGLSYGFVLPSDPVSKGAYDYKIIQNSKIVQASGQDCRNYYPSKYTTTENINCEIPTKAVFEICADFESVRAFDANGIDQSTFGWDRKNAFGVAGMMSSESYYSPVYFDSYNNSPHWNHDAVYTCFTRTIDPLKYPQY